MFSPPVRRRLDGIAILLVLGTCFLSILYEPKIPATAAGLAVSNSFQILLFFSMLVRTTADVDANIASAARVASLGELEGEPAGGCEAPSVSWPSAGAVDFNNVVMSYAPNAPHVLKGITLSIRGGEKIGVVGRTGAGKSSLIIALFRL